MRVTPVLTPAGAAEDAALAAATEDEDVALEAATDDEDVAPEVATDDEDVALEAATEDEDAALEEATEEATKALPADVLAAAELAAPTLALLAPAAGVPDAPIVKSYKSMIVRTDHD